MIDPWSDRLSAETLRDVVAQGMRSLLFLRDLAAAVQAFYIGMVLRPLVDLTAAEQIQAAVTDVCPPGTVALHQTGHTSGARLGVWIPAASVPEYFRVCLVDAGRQEGCRILEWATCPLKAPREGLHHGLCGEFAVLVTAHAVREHQQNAIPVIDDSQTVLVDLPVAEPIGLIGLVAHDSFSLGSSGSAARRPPVAVTLTRHPDRCSLPLQRAAYPWSLQRGPAMPVPVHRRSAACTGGRFPWTNRWRSTVARSTAS